MDIKPLSHTTPLLARKEYLHQRMMEGGLVHPPSTSPLLPGIDDEGFSSVAQTSANQMIDYYGRKKFKVSTL